MRKIDAMNPLRWKRVYLVLWLACTAAGSVAGLIFGWFLSPFSHVRGGGGTMFFAYLHYPAAWWPSVVVATITIALFYYMVGILRGTI
jgi:hypothetical protein